LRELKDEEFRKNAGKWRRMGKTASDRQVTF
jgi:hypothetical protein